MKTLVLTVILLVAPFAIANASAASDVTLYSYDLANITVDGDIGNDEYATYFDAPLVSGSAAIEVHWAHNGTHLAVGITGTFTGWVGFGMNTGGNGMKGSDMIISGVTAPSDLEIGDYHATGNTPPTIDDDQMPILGAGKDDGSKTTVEFIIPMKSSDTAGQDHSWSEGGTYNFFIAYHDTDDSLTYHSGRTDVLEVSVADASVELPANRKVTVGGGSEIDLTQTIYGLLIVVAMFGLFIFVVKRNATLN